MKEIYKKDRAALIVFCIMLCVWIVIFVVQLSVEKDRTERLQRIHYSVVEEYAEMLWGIIDAYQDNVLDLNNEEQSQDIQSLIGWWDSYCFKYLTGQTEEDFEEYLIRNNSMHLLYLIEMIY